MHGRVARILIDRSCSRNYRAARPSNPLPLETSIDPAPASISPPGDVEEFKPNPADRPPEARTRLRDGDEVGPRENSKPSLPPFRCDPGPKTRTQPTVFLAPSGREFKPNPAEPAHTSPPEFKPNCDPPEFKPNRDPPEFKPNAGISLASASRAGSAGRSGILSCPARSVISRSSGRAAISGRPARSMAVPCIIEAVSEVGRSRRLQKTEASSGGNASCGGK